MMDVPETGSYLDHERLDAYGVAREFAVLAETLSRRLPRGKGQLGDQLLRASESILLRIAEGSAARRKTPERSRHFRAALGSTYECAAALDILFIRRTASAGALREARTLLERLAKMLGALAKKA